MAIPAAYTEETLIQFCLTELGDVASVLGWAADTEQVAEAVNDALAAYGISDIADATDIATLRRLARWAIWRQAANSIVTRYTFATDSGQRWERQGMVDAVLARARQAETDALADLPGYAVELVSADDRRDPYRYLPEEARL